MRRFVAPARRITHDLRVLRSNPLQLGDLEIGCDSHAAYPGMDADPFQPRLCVGHHGDTRDGDWGSDLQRVSVRVIAARCTRPSPPETRRRSPRATPAKRSGCNRGRSRYRSRTPELTSRSASCARRTTIGHDLDLWVAPPPASVPVRLAASSRPAPIRPSPRRGDIGCSSLSSSFPGIPRCARC